MSGPAAAAGVQAAIAPPAGMPTAAREAVLAAPLAAPPTAAAPTPAAPSLATPTPAEPVPAQVEPLPAAPTRDPAAPVSLRAAVLPATSEMSGLGFSVPFDQHVAAAAFRRGPYAYIVFDQPRPIDLAGLHGDPALGEAAVTVLPAATVIRLPLPPGRGIALTPSAASWAVRLAPLAIPPRPTAPHLVDGRLLFTLDAPGAVVAVPDPDTGALLLVGTQRKPGQGIAAPRRTPGFTLLPSWQGIALEPFADTLTLQTIPGGFALAASDGLALLPRTEADALGDAALLTRRYDFPALPSAALLQRLKAQMQSCAEAPPLARGPLRRLAAQTLLALAMGAEAAGLLELAAIDDPRAANDPDQIGLSAIAALLAGRTKETEGLDDPRLADTDEVALWRAVRLAQQHEAAPEAAAAFAAMVKLALAYPAPLRARLLPLMAETMAAGGEVASAQSLLASLPADPSLGLARAMVAQAQGDAKAALADYDQLARGSDRLVRAQAAAHAVELRLATHALDPAGAAAAYEPQLSYWRGDGREFALRMRLADMRAQAGQWRPAFALLRETAIGFPEETTVLAREKALFAAFVDGDQGGHLAPLDFVAFVDENADLMPDGPAGDALADRLADRLAELDLPSRAGPLLQKLVDHAKAPLARAAFGTRLAELRLGNQDAAGARTALATTDASDLPDGLAERRALVAARAAARAGEIDHALAALSPFNSAAAMGARAQILEDAKDWPRAVAVLTDLVARTVPPQGALDESKRRVILRLAAAAAAASDTATLARLREHDLPRSGTGSDADLLRVLTEAPVTSVTDLARARSETQSARSVAARLAQASAPSAGPNPGPATPSAAAAGKPAPPR